MFGKVAIGVALLLVLFAAGLYCWKGNLSCAGAAGPKIAGVMLIGVCQ
jgi:hypothetical protein